MEKESGSIKAAFFVEVVDPKGWRTPPPPMGRDEVEDDELEVVWVFNDLIFLRDCVGPPLVPKRNSLELDRFRFFCLDSFSWVFVGVVVEVLVLVVSSLEGLLILPRGKFTSSMMG